MPNVKCNLKPFGVAFNSDVAMNLAMAMSILEHFNV